MKFLLITLSIFTLASCSSREYQTASVSWEHMNYTELSGDFMCSDATMKLVKGGC